MIQHSNQTPLRFGNVILLLLVSGAAALLVSPVLAGTGVTISAEGSQSYYLGEKVYLSGTNSNSDSTYLFITGYSLPAAGGELTSPDTPVVNGNPGTFTVVKTNPDKSWDYSWYTEGLKLDAGTYTLYAASEPKAKDQLADAAYGTTSIIIKKPFITAGISPVAVTKGQPFTITGNAEGIPPNVRIWIFGKNYVFNATTPVNSDASFSYKADAATSGTLPEGQDYLVVEHPMADNLFDLVVSGDYVRSLKLNNGTNLFKVTGPGSLQGIDAADALITAISDQNAHDDTYSNDTYTLIPFQVAGAGSSVTATVAGTSPGKGVTITADGGQSYYLGEKVFLSGANNNSDSTYLFITGPNLPVTGGELTSPRTPAVSGNPDTFVVVTIKPDKTWDYSWSTSGLMLDAGTYTIYAASKPKTKDQLAEAAYGATSMIIRKPFIDAAISPSPVQEGQPFTITGNAVGNPPDVRIWIFGDNFAFTTTTPVNPDASFTFTGNATVSGRLPGGQNYLVVQHPMADNQFDLVVSGDYVRSLKLNNGTDLFKITGPGSLQGGDAADALVAAFRGSVDNGNHEADMYTLIPFQVTPSGIPALSEQSSTTPQARLPGPAERTLADLVLKALGFNLGR